MFVSRKCLESERICIMDMAGFLLCTVTKLSDKDLCVSPHYTLPDWYTSYSYGVFCMMHNSCSHKS